MNFPKPLAKLINELAKLPSIGPKSANRLAFHLLSIPKEDALKLAGSITEALDKIKTCQECYSLTEHELCDICQDSSRDTSTLCVVEESADVVFLEKAKIFNGRYHILQGNLNPLKNKGPQELKIKELIQRLSENLEIKEVILATSSTPEGEATAMYLHRLIKPSGIKITRIAHGLPMGSQMEYVDTLTLTHAIKGRIELA